MSNSNGATPMSLARGTFLRGTGAAALVVSAASTATAMTTAYRVGRYTYSGPGTVNTWWIEQHDSIVVIDVQRDLHHARAARDKIRALNKPVRAVLITHGHPDHYAGLEVFRAAWPSVDIYASPATYREMQTDPHGYMPFVHKLEGADAPRIVPLPNRLSTMARSYVSAN